MEERERERGGGGGEKGENKLLRAQFFRIESFNRALDSFDGRLIEYEV